MRLVERTVDDIKGILNIIRQPVTKASIYVAADESSSLFLRIAENLILGRKDSEIIRNEISGVPPAVKSTLSQTIQSAIKHYRNLGQRRC